jgi:hypothetical protein
MSAETLLKERNARVALVARAFPWFFALPREGSEGAVAGTPEKVAHLESARALGDCARTSGAQVNQREAPVS